MYILTFSLSITNKSLRVIRKPLPVDMLCYWCLSNPLTRIFHRPFYNQPSSVSVMDSFLPGGNGGISTFIHIVFASVLSLCLGDTIESRASDYKWSDIESFKFQSSEIGYWNINMTWVSFYQHVLTTISICSNNHLTSKMWDEITYPFPSFNSCNVQFENG